MGGGGEEWHATVSGALFAFRVDTQKERQGWEIEMATELGILSNHPCCCCFSLSLFSSSPFWLTGWEGMPFLFGMVLVILVILIQLIIAINHARHSKINICVLYPHKHTWIHSFHSIPFHSIKLKIPSSAGTRKNIPKE